MLFGVVTISVFDAFCFILCIGIRIVSFFFGGSSLWRGTVCGEDRFNLFVDDKASDWLSTVVPASWTSLVFVDDTSGGATFTELLSVTSI